LTFFSGFPGYQASNPVVSDDGWFMAFQMASLKGPGVAVWYVRYGFAEGEAGKVIESTSQKFLSAA